MTSPPLPTGTGAQLARHRLTRLPRQLALAYTVLIVYASLHPFTGWRNPGLSPFEFLSADWPRYWTVFDLVFNACAYLPLGFLLALALHHLPRRWLVALTTLLLGSGISLSLEALQSWLPSRVPSHLDLACNALGTGLGALIAQWHGEIIFRRILQIQKNLLTQHPHAESGLVLIGLWLLTQLSPETLLFGTGDLRYLLDIPPALPYAAHSFFFMETAIIVCHTLAIGLIATTLFSNRHAAVQVLVLFFSLALAIRTLAAAILVDPLHAFVWLTPGAGLGLMIGLALLLLALLLPTSLHLPLAGLALMAGTVVVNLTPPNPYSTVALAAWRHGHFLNFNGLTRLVSSCWPFLALPYLTLLARRSPKH